MILRIKIARLTIVAYPSTVRGTSMKFLVPLFATEASHSNLQDPGLYRCGDTLRSRVPLQNMHIGGVVMPQLLKCPSQILLSAVKLDQLSMCSDGDRAAISERTKMYKSLQKSRGQGQRVQLLRIQIP